jgi:1-deoxy-D-xylulose-5-phosphate synthase
MVMPALEAAARLEADGISATVVNCRFIKPLDEATLSWVLDRHGAVLTIEEGTVVNGFGAYLAAAIEGTRTAHPRLLVDVLGVPDRIIEHASRAEQLAEVGLDVAGIVGRARALAATGALPVVRETA